jgi:hypothetical protein
MVNAWEQAARLLAEIRSLENRDLNPEETFRYFDLVDEYSQLLEIITEAEAND